MSFTTKTWRKSSCLVSGCTALISLFQMKSQILVSLREIALQQPLSPLKYSVWITILDISFIKQWNVSLFWNDLDCNPWYEAWLSCAIASGVPESFAAFAFSQKPGEAEWERFCSPSLRFISGFRGLLTLTRNVVNLSKMHAVFQFS